MNSEQIYLIQRLTMSLDTCLDLVTREARKEIKAGEGKALRPITWQERAKSFDKLVDEANAALGEHGRAVPR